MTIKTETSLKDFHFWSGARLFAEKLTSTELDFIEEALTECYPDGIDDVTLNDIFWFDQEELAEWIGTDVDEIFARE